MGGPALRPAPCAVAVLLCAAAAGGDPEGYDGKYRDDPRLARIARDLPARAAKARARLAEVLGVEVPAVPVRLEDAGHDASGAMAETRATQTRSGFRTPVVVLRTEYLVLGAMDVDATLVHEHYHALQRTRLGADGYRHMPPWAREGAAQYVAGQGPWRARVLAGHVARLGLGDPLAVLVGPLEGPLPFERYYLAVAAFEAVEARLGRERAVTLARRLLDEPDARRAVEAEVGPFLRFEEEAQARARRLLVPLLDAAAGNHPYDRARALYARGEHRAALAALESLRRDATTLLGEAVLLDLRCRKELGDPSFPEALARARLDLEPFAQHAELDALAGEEE